MKKRTLESILEIALKTFPVVLLNGARQVGKSTLALDNFKNYLTFDDGELRLYAKENPKGFLKNLEFPICLDEIQKVPTILEYIKMHIDSNRVNGDFLLTGSSNVLDHKDSKDTLAGRLCELRLHPLSSKEKNDKPFENIIEIDKRATELLSEIDATKINKGSPIEDWLIKQIEIKKLFNGNFNSNFEKIKKIKENHKDFPVKK
jgi:predicted AAA+ superfamily ATPase